MPFDFSNNQNDDFAPISGPSPFIDDSGGGFSDLPQSGGDFQNDSWSFPDNSGAPKNDFAGNSNSFPSGRSFSAPSLPQVDWGKILFILGIVVGAIIIFIFRNEILSFFANLFSTIIAGAIIIIIIIIVFKLLLGRRW